MAKLSPQDDPDLLDLLLAEMGVERLPVPEFRHECSTPPPLSRAQRRLWFLQQITPDSPLYTISCAVQLSGRLDRVALEATISEIVDRHESLRASFPAVDGRPTMISHGECQFHIPVNDLTRLTEAEKHMEVRRLCSEETRRPFDLSVAPLLRLRLLRLDEIDHVALLTMHHIVSDGWSMGVLLNEMNQLYRAFADGRPPTLPPLPLQYSDFASWQERWMGQGDGADQRRWWTDRLRGLTSLELPTDRPRPAKPSYRGGSHVFRLPMQLSSHIKRLARQEEATLFMTLLAAFSVLLHRYSGQDDIVIGSPVANRNHREFEPLIGCFVNSLVMRCDLSGRPNFLDILRRVREFALEALARQEFPFDELVKELAPERDTASNPLFQVMFSLENAPMGALQLPELRLTPIDVETRVAKFDLLLNMSETPDGLLGAFEYSADLFDADTIARMADHFTTLLEAIAADPEADIATLPLLSAAKRREILIDWNDNARAYPRDEPLHRLFETQVRRTPDAPAAEFGGRQMTYHELNARANQLAHHLQECGVGLETPVAIHVERSVDILVGLLAILKVGGCYVPVDPAYPQQRLQLMLSDCMAPVLLTHSDLVGKLSQPEGVTAICLDDGDIFARHGEHNLALSQVCGTSLAYVVYTSGSTGAPKGVAIPHRAVSRLVLNTNYVDLGPDDCIAQASSISFDAATFEIWGALLNGARLVGVERDVTLSPSDFVAFLRERRVTTLFLTTALFNQMSREIPDGFSTLRHVLFGGERVDPSAVREVLRHGPPQRLLHVYGPTENTTFSTWYLVRDLPSDVTTVPIGKAVSNTETYVLDVNQQPLPVGVPGELYLAGDGLARGYFRRPDLAEKRFVANPFDSDHTKLYRTGDIVRWLPSGDIEFVGRRDNQVKIRGFRVELGEIEAALVRHPAVREAVVVAREDRPAQRELVAYVVAESASGLESQQLREDLAEQLPTFMVPSKYVILKTLPLNRNGKVDREALPAPLETPESERRYEPARSEQEKCLAAVWQDVLGCAAVGIHDNYFELGGDSITAIQVVSRLRRHGFLLRVADLFRHPTIAQLASSLQTDEPIMDPSLEAAESGEKPLTAIQRWFFDHHHGNRNHFNQAVLLKATGGQVDEGSLRVALSELLRRHDALRLTFVEEGEVIRQVCRLPGGEPPALEVIDLCQGAELVTTLERHASEIQRSIDLTRGPLMKVALLHGADGDRLLLVIHHLAVDGVSWRILLEELELAYSQATSGQPTDLGLKTCSFGRWAEYVQGLANSDALLSELVYWSRLDQAAVPQLPLANADATNRYGDTQTLHASLSEEETVDLLTRSHSAYQTEIMDLLLTALGIALQRWTGQDSNLLITLEGHGRDWPDNALDLTRTVGWFTSLFPFELAVPGQDVGQKLLHVKDRLRSIPNKGIGYGLLRYVAGQQTGWDPGAGPQISFNYLGQFEYVGECGGRFEFSSEPTGLAIDPHLTRVHELDFGGIISDSRLILSLEYNPLRLPASTAIALLADFKHQLVALIDHCRYATNPVLRRFGSGAVEDVYPLSPMQEGLLFQSLVDPDTEVYCIQATHRIQGLLRADVFQHCWNILTRRHAVLRSVFLHEGLERPLQVVLKERSPEFHIFDICGLTVEEQLQRIDQFRREERERGFNLQQDVLMHVTVFHRENEAHELIWSYHHILLDGWCLGVIYRELIQLYRALCQGQEPHLPPVAPFRRYIDWLRHFDREKARNYWADYTAGYDRIATFPKSQTEDVHHPICETNFVLEATVTAGLKRLAVRHGVTLNTVVQCLWGLLLCHHNDIDDVIFGAVVSGRPSDLDGVEDMVGMFINTLPVRIRYDHGQTFAELLEASQQAALESQPHGYLSLAEIQALSPLGRNLFDHLVVFENYPRHFSQHEGALDTMPWNVETVEIRDNTHYELAVMIDVGECIDFRLAYRSVYSPEQISRLMHQLAIVARHVVEDPEQPVSQIPLMSAAERQQVLLEWNATAADYPLDRCLHQWIEDQAERASEKIAVVLAGSGERLTYRELNVRANQLARYLRRLGVGPESVVGILAERSLEMVVGLLGILKAGGAYVPLDPDYPRQRLEFMVSDAQVAVLLTQGEGSGRLPSTASPVVRLDADWPVISGEDEANVAVEEVGPDNVAYVIYTSGSTGRPKGCQIEHRNLMHYLNWASRYYYPDGEGGSFGLFTSLAFDLTVTSLFLPLIRGQTLRIFPQEATLDSILRAYFHPAAALDSIKLTPAHISLLPSLSLPKTKIQVAIVGGEQLLVDQVKSLWRINPQMRIYNEYGPTEATVGCVVKQILPSEDRILIGQPIDNTRVYVLDNHLQPLPVGVPGQLYIGGKGLARGYLNQPELTTERFIPDPFLTEAGARLYRSGDLVRWMPDGNLECLGRLDHQVKIRGFRIELGEIETALARHPHVREAVVQAERDPSGEVRLLAWIVPQGSPKPTADELRYSLRERLPDYMLPAAFVLIDALPLSPNGKVDRAALAELGARGPSPTVPHQPARNRWEEQLIRIWQSTLQVDAIGVGDNFFDLGGHSLKAMQIVAQIHRQVGAKLHIRDVFDHPTVAELATVVAAAPRLHAVDIPLAPVQEDYELSHAQHRLWLLHHLEGASAYNMPEAYVFDFGLDVPALEQAFNTLIERHEALRTAFVTVDGETRQKILPQLPFHVREIDLRGTEDPEHEARAIADREAITPFDLTRPPLFRVTVVRLADQRCVFLLTIHHIVGDGWSRVVLYREVLELLDAFQTGRPHRLRPPRIQYKDFAAWQNTRSFAREESYWLERLAELPADPLRLPYDFAQTDPRDFRGDMAHAVLESEVVAGLRALARRKGTTLSNVMLAVFELFLYQWTRQNDICLGLSAANRNHPDLENLIGFFVNILPIRCPLSDDLEFDDLLALVVERTYEAFEHQDYPFDLLIRKLNPARYMNRQPLVNVIYGFQNFADVHVDVLDRQPTPVELRGRTDSALDWTMFDFTFGTSKFDLTLFVFEDVDELQLTLEFDSTLFLAETILQQLETIRCFASMVAMRASES